MKGTSMEQPVEKKKFDWGKAVELLKDGVDLAGKIVGGRNALIAGTAGLAIGFGAGALLASPSQENCQTYYQEQAKKQNDARREWLLRRSTGW